MIKRVPEVGESVSVIFEDGHVIVGKIVEMNDQEVKVSGIKWFRRTMLKPALVGWEVLIGKHPDLIKLRTVLKNLDET